MSTTYKNIVYDGATLIAGGDIHIGDVIYHAAEDFHHSILFLRIEGIGQSYIAQLSIKSRHNGAGRLGKSGEPLLREEIALQIPERLFHQVEALQETRRSAGDLLRNVGANSAHAIQAQEAQVSQAIFTAFFSGDIGTVCRDFIQLLQKRKVSELLNIWQRLAVAQSLPLLEQFFAQTEGATMERVRDLLNVTIHVHLKNAIINSQIDAGGNLFIGDAKA